MVASIGTRCTAIVAIAWVSTKSGSIGRSTLQRSMIGFASSAEISRSSSLGESEPCRAKRLPLATPSIGKFMRRITRCNSSVVESVTPGCSAVSTRCWCCVLARFHSPRCNSESTRSDSMICLVSSRMPPRKNTRSEMSMPVSAVIPKSCAERSSAMARGSVF